MENDDGTILNHDVNNDVKSVSIIIDAARNRSLSLVAKKKTLFGSRKLIYEEFLKSIRNQCTCFEEEINYVLSYLNLKSQEKFNRFALCSQIEYFLNRNGSLKLKCCIFGSSINGLGFMDSDVDIRLMCHSNDKYGYEQSLIDSLSETVTPENAQKLESHFAKHTVRGKDEKAYVQRMLELKPNFDKRSKDVVEAIRKILANHSAFSEVTGFCSGRSSLVKFSFAGHPCEISLGCEIALLNTIFAKIVLKTCEVLRTMVSALNFICKSSRHFMNASLSRISSYCVFCMVTSVICEFDCGFKRSFESVLEYFKLAHVNQTFSEAAIPHLVFSESMNSEDVFGLVLNRIIEKDLSTHVFSPFLGGVVPFTRLYIPPCTESFTLSELNIQDPFELEHNIASNISKVAAWKKELRRVASLFNQGQRLADIYIQFVGFDRPAAEDNAQLLRKPIIESLTSSDPIKSNLILLQTITLEPKKRKKGEEFFPEDFKIWSFEALKAILFCLKHVYCGILSDFALKILDESMALAEVIWPFCFHCLIERDVWRGRRNVKQSMFPKSHKAEISEEETVSRTLFERRTNLMDVVNLQVKCESQFKSIKFKVSLYGSSILVHKKCGLAESFDTLLVALFKKIMDGK